jgi:hypothetical protein
VESAFQLLLEHHKRASEQQSMDGPQASLAGQLRVQRANTRLLSLDEAIGLALERQCMDARDKIFGLQACIDPSQQVEVDYDLTEEQLFWRVLRVFGSSQKSGALSSEKRSHIAFQLRMLLKQMRLEQMSEHQIGRLLSTS